MPHQVDELPEIRAHALLAGSPPRGSIRLAEAKEQIHLVLLAQDDVLEEVLQRLGTALLAGVRDAGLQRIDAVGFTCDECLHRVQRVAVEAG